MQLYLLLDTSGSMDGAKISALNDSMENIIVDLQEKALKEKRTVKQTHVTIIEGSYAMHPLLRKYYDYMIYLTIDPQTQQNRIYERNPEKYDDFMNRWIPLEERYFTAYCFEKICNICIKAEEW